jgi:hypothetical protein
MRNQSSTITNSRAGPSYARHDGKESHGSREADKAIEQAGKRSYYVRIANPRVLGELAGGIWWAERFRIPVGGDTRGGAAKQPQEISGEQANSVFTPAYQELYLRYLIM